MGSYPNVQIRYNGGGSFFGRRGEVAIYLTFDFVFPKGRAWLLLRRRTFLQTPRPQQDLDALDAYCGFSLSAPITYVCNRNALRIAI